MNGINLDKLDKLIEVNDFNHDSLSSNIKNLNINLNGLTDCYAGRDIEFVFSELVNQVDDLNKISEVVKSYSEVLSEVKTSYVQQDILIRDSLIHANNP